MWMRTGNGTLDDRVHYPRRGAVSVAVGTVLLCLSILSACTQSEPKHALTSYVTEYGLGPDKWATAWLLTRHATPDSRLIVSDAGAPLADGIAFDMPSSGIRRIGNRSAFEIAKEQYELSDPVLDELAKLVYEIEVNFWAAGGPAEADAIEEAYRELQYRHGRDAVTPKCYVAFFDRVYQVLKDAKLNSIPFTLERLHMSCEELSLIAEKGRDLIPEVPIIDVLSAAAAGRKVVFVDVREVDEFVEGHIPGALNIPIRDVNAKLRERLNDADYVVSYCVKDFRGFEMAKALADIGVVNSVIMRPYGIKGWVQLGLPLTGSGALEETQGQAALEACFRDLAGCLARSGDVI